MEDDVPQRKVNYIKFSITFIPKNIIKYFSFDSKKEAPVSKYAFPNEDEEQEDSMNIPKQNQYGASSSHASASYQTSKYESSKQIQLPSHPPPTGPPVLDKFGNFRRAEQADVDKPPEPPAFRSRSHSRTRSSRSCK